MKKIILFIVLFVSNSVFAQQQDCSCNQAFEKLIVKIETEYPGFEYKTKDLVAYNDFKENLAKQVVQATKEGCPTLLKKYANYFKDPHMWVSSSILSSISESTTSRNSIVVDIVDFKQKIESSKDKYEGIWSYESYTFGLKKTGENEYTGFVIEAKSPLWKPKDIKFKLFSNGTFEYALLDRTLQTGNYQFHNEGILFLDGVNIPLLKQSPKPTASAQQIKEKLQELQGFYFKKINTKTAIVKFPSFEYHHLKTIDSLIENNKNLLEESQNLIIDLRGNPGGTTDAYQKLLPYISGKNIHHLGAEFLATQTYINNLQAYKKTLNKDSPSEGIDNQIKKLEENLGKFVNFASEKPETIPLASKSPKNVIVLADKGTGSSAEYFLIIAKQSKKVKIIGTPSYGALDYGNAYTIDFGCKDYQLFMPTYRALRLPDFPIDNIGVQPDLFIDKSVKDWISFAVDYLEE
mgnify:FL=1